MRAAERSKASVFAERNCKCVGAAVCCPVGNVGDSHCAVRLLARYYESASNFFHNPCLWLFPSAATKPAQDICSKIMSDFLESDSLEKNEVWYMVFACAAGPEVTQDAAAILSAVTRGAVEREGAPRRPQDTQMG